MNRKSICNTLGHGDDRYYVYMLCDKSTKQPFYIGKGQDMRVFDHEKGTEKLYNDIEKAIRENFKDQGLKPSDKNIQRTINDRMGKLKKETKISELLDSDNLETVIIKWGLAEKEAYMAESALINMYKFIGGDDSLTNIVNGHMSDKEKNNRFHTTKAQNVEKFYENCVEPEKSLTDILKAYFGKSYTKKTAKDGCGILFVTINNLYPMCAAAENAEDKDAAIKDAASGFWNVKEDWLDIIKYVFALYKSQIVGIYPVNKDSWIQKQDLGEIDTDNGKAVLTATGKELPFALKDVREPEYKKITDQIKNGTLKKDKKGKYRMFLEADLTSGDEELFEKIHGEFFGKYISLPRDTGARNPLYYNFNPDKTFRESLKVTDEEQAGENTGQL